MWIYVRAFITITSGVPLSGVRVKLVLVRMNWRAGAGGKLAGMAINRIRAVWTGFVGAPGYTSWYFLPESTGMAATMRTFFDAIKGQLAAPVSVQVESTGDVIDETDGKIVGAWNESAVAVVNAGGVGIYSAPVGAVVRWNTGGIVNGHRVKGRSFLVPLDGDAYDSSGTLTSAAITTMEAAATAAIADVNNQLGVWARPFKGALTKPARNGSIHVVTGRTVPDKSMVLRSRRD